MKKRVIIGLIAVLMVVGAAFTPPVQEVLDENGNSPGTFVCGQYDVAETIGRLERELDEAVAIGDEDTAAMRRTDIVAAGMC